ncbi:hypothetical protein BX666DRAFT_1994979 [Dichotomocladium elegans]|nr:hypothetical protein BX666DRAFT_1994979 [Dichotomocladium elegans]
MVDVVGFSKLTTLATEKGVSGAEAIALEIGTYMGECIQIIESYGGDVVKFLGDAVLVSFQPSLDDPTADLSEMTKESLKRRKSHLVRRAVECGQQLLARLSHYRVYLTAEERTKHRAAFGESDSREKAREQRFFLFDGQSTGDSSTSNTSTSSQPSNNSNTSTRINDEAVSTNPYMKTRLWNCLPSLINRHQEANGRRSRRQRRQLLVGNNNRKQHSRIYAHHRASLSTETLGRNVNAIDLELHIAVSCGDLTNVILGERDPQLTSQQQELQKHQHQQLDDIVAENIKGSYNQPPFSPDSIEYTGRLEYAICGPAVEWLEDALAAAKAGEMTITPEVYRLVQLNPPLYMSYEKRNQFYLVKAKVQWNRHHHLPPTPSANNSMQNLPKPQPPPAYNSRMMSNPNYFKYVNRSALYRLRRGSEGNFTAQFRDVTIMFISLGKLNVATPKGLDTAQKALVSAIRLLVQYDGMLQQFAVDDKGPTLLAVFGLPPLSHEREAVFAAKAAIDIRDAYRQIDLPDFSIALSSGTIFSAVLPQGNPYRRDPSISGETIILAVRMLKFPFAIKNVVCDEATKQQIRGLCEFKDKGVNNVKGKIKPIQIYQIMRFGQPGKPKRAFQTQQQGDFIGYKLEMERATQLIDDWHHEAQNRHVLIISGPSGVGKSFFCQTIARTITSLGVQACWSFSTEVEKGSKYFLIKSLLISLFEIIDSDGLPDNIKRRMSFVQGPFVGPQSANSGANALSSNAADRSSTSSLISMEPLSRLQSASSIRCYNASSHNNGDVNNELAELIRKCLKKCGETDNLLPLFKAVFMSLADLEENKYTIRLDGRARDILLSDVIIKMVRHVSEHVELVFICDDVQWADSASIKVLHQVHEQCPRVMLIMATRTMRDYNLTFIKDFCKSGTHREIALNGLGADEIGEIIIQAFKSGVVKSVNPEIVRVFQKRTAGNPLYVKNMAIVLKDFNKHITVMDGELIASSSEFDLADTLGNFDYKRIIKMQFDRLDAGFQEFLTAASFLDQSFTIQEVMTIISHDNAIFRASSLSEVIELIMGYDRYHFLQVVEKPGLQEVNPGDITFSFAHITIPECIYAMVSFGMRRMFHESLAQHYEEQMKKENDIDLLPKIARHYLKISNPAKQLMYLEKLADHNIRSFCLPEATENLRNIVRILDGNEEDDAIQYSRGRRSDVYRRLGICYTMRTKLSEGERYLHMALETLGHPWPETNIKFFSKFWMNRALQYQHRRWGSFGTFKSNRKKEVWKRIVEIMVHLSNIYYYTGKGRHFIYTCLLGLNACERLGREGGSEYYIFFLARNSLLCWLNDQKNHSVFYIQQAQYYASDKHEPGNLTINAMLHFAAGAFHEARTFLYQSIEAVKTLGVITDCQAFYRSVGLVLTMRIFEGKLSNSPDDLRLLKQMAELAHVNGDYEAEVWIGVYNAGNAIITDRLRDCEPFVTLLEAHIKETADYNQIAIYGTLVCYYARMRNHENARRHLRLLVHSLPSLTVTFNTFPIFGLIFATMGLYRMIEDDEVKLLSSEDKKSYDRFNLVVARINHAFQQVKFWEFTQPCLYLARALPYIATGRTVEGCLVLQHGYYEMHNIKEITFLKGYYMANLGKFAFTPDERKKWTESARAEFDLLDIPTHIYCNPDPAAPLPTNMLALTTKVEAQEE